MRIGKALANGSRPARPPVDEVARNGAFRKQLRPEVLPGAPLQLLFFGLAELSDFRRR